jgi:Protein of unknown function (DUF3307)
MPLIYVYLLLVHWLADFVLQNNWMAINKSKSILALLEHSVVYMGSLYALTLGAHLGWAVLNGCLHLLIDYVTSKINSKLWLDKRVHGFFVSVGFDQFLHVSILLLTWRML